MFCWKRFGFVALSAVLLSGASGSQAQVSIEIGAPPVCPYGYYDYAPYNCSPTGTMGRIGSLAGCSLELDPGSTVLTASMATSTTAMILAMVTPVRCRDAGSSHSITSMRTRRGTRKAT
jgi:hypothetical protein